MSIASVAQDVSQCSTCTHLRSWVVTGTTTMCAAFPGGMSDAVWSNMIDHRLPVDGDHGVLWESNGEPHPEADPPDGERGWEGEWERLAGKDTHPGGEQLKHYWTEDPEGLAKWVNDPHPYDALYEHLLAHMDGNEALAHKTAGAWYFKVFGHGPTAGHHDGRGFDSGLHPHYPPGAPGGKGGEFMPKAGAKAKNALKAALDGPALQAIRDDIKAKSPADARAQLMTMRVPELKQLMAHAGIKGGRTKAEFIDRLLGPADTPAVPKVATAAATRAPATPVPIRDLFAADDATIETAMRDVYEGQFGPYTTKVKVHITRAGTKVDRKGRESAVEPRISVDGKIYDATGVEIGHFGRSIGPTVSNYAGSVRREIWAEHHTVQLGGGDYDENPTKYHGKGFGTAFNRRAINWYRAAGVHGIAQSDHNGYVWASQGFGFPGGIVPQYKADQLRTLVAALRAGQTKSDGKTIPKAIRDAPNLAAQLAAAEELLARLASTRPGEPGYPTAYEISQLGRRDGQRGKTALWLGKHLGVSADEMILNPDEGEVIQ